MCIIAYVPKDKTVNEETITNMFQNNPDGAGLLYVDGDTLKTFKTFDLFKLLDMYEYVKAHFDTDIIIHCRIGTHGGKTMENIHPFMVNENLGFVHNGIISSMPSDVHKSDTRMFNELILQKLPDNFIFDEAIKELIGGYITSSKLAFMDSFQNVAIINEDKGVWNQGVWFSNTTYMDIYEDYRYNTKTMSGYYGNRKQSTTCNVVPFKGKTTYQPYDNYYGEIEDDELITCHGCGLVIEPWESSLGIDNEYYCEDCYDIILEICPNCEGDLISTKGGSYCENCSLVFNNTYETIAEPIDNVIGDDLKEERDDAFALKVKDGERIVSEGEFQY